MIVDDKSKKRETTTKEKLSPESKKSKASSSNNLSIKYVMLPSTEPLESYPSNMEVDEEEVKQIPQDTPSKMNMQQLLEILQHSYNNDKLGKVNRSAFLKARDNMLKNKSDKKIRDSSKTEFKRIYKEAIYKQ